MEIWFDGTNRASISTANRQGILKGVTTNPSILAAANTPLDPLVETLLTVQPGPVAIQVTASEASEMIQQGKRLHTHNTRIIVKVPVTAQGLEAIHALTKNGIPTMATAVFYPRQFLLAALAGADYVAPYIGLMLEEAGEDPLESLEEMMMIKRNYKLKAKLLGAALRDLREVTMCAEIGLDAVTLKESLFAEMTHDPEPTLQHIKRFAVDWKTVSQNTLI